MPRTIAERTCNLTLTRNEWAILLRLLDCTTHQCAMPCRMQIRATLNADQFAASVCIPKEAEKWATVLQAVYKEAIRRGGEYNRLLGTMTKQISAATFRGGEQ